MRKIFIDCGAWYGNSISKFRSMYSDWQEYEIFAFEANKDVCEIGKLAMPNVTWINAGVWDSDGERSLRTGTGKWSEGSTFFKHKRYSEIRGQKNYQRVKTIDLSKWILENFSPDDNIVLKMNVEGAEYKVLPKMVKDNTIVWISDLYVDWHWHKISIEEDKHNQLVSSLPIQWSSWDNKHKKKCIYTVLTGDNPAYTLKEPTRITEGWDYICFTDRKDLKSNTWQIRQLNENKITSVLLSRKVKILCDYYLPEYGISIYIDSKFTVRINLDSFVYNNHRKCITITVMKHPRRNTPYEECIKLGKLNLAQFYRDVFYGLFAPGIMVRDHHEIDIIKLCRLWFGRMNHDASFDDHIIRDIPALSYALDKAKFFKIKELDFKQVTGLFK